MKIAGVIALNIQIAALFFALGFYLNSIVVQDSSKPVSSQNILEEKSAVLEKPEVAAIPQIPEEPLIRREDFLVFAKESYSEIKSLARFIMKPVVRAGGAQPVTPMVENPFENLIREDQFVAYKKRMLQGPVYKSVQSIDEDKVLGFIKSSTNFDRDDFDSRFTLPEVAQALYDIAHESPEGQWFSPLYFGSQVDSQNRVTDGKNVFPVDQKGIIASFEVPGGGVTTVLAKWLRDGDEEPIIYEKAEVDPNKEYNFVGASPKDGTWEEGTYTVEIYNVGDSFSNISGGTFTIEAVLEEGVIPEIQ